MHPCLCPDAYDWQPFEALNTPSQPVDTFFVCCMGAVTGLFVLFSAYACGSCIARHNDPETWAALEHELDECDMKGYAEVLEEEDEEDGAEKEENEEERPDDSSDMSDVSDGETNGRPKED